MNTLLMKVKTVANLKLSDDQFVEDCMTSLISRWPEIQGYTYERLDKHYINILMWGDIHEPPR